MPTYNYTCKKCDHIQEEFRHMADCNDPTKCDKCGAKALKSLSTPALHLVWGEDKFAREHEIEGNGVRS